MGARCEDMGMGPRGGSVPSGWHWLERANPVLAAPALWSMMSPCVRVNVMCQLHWATAGGRRETVG